MTYAGIAISGKAGAGKDTFGAVLREELAKFGVWAVRIGFADEPKADVLRLYGLTKEDEGGREKLIEYSDGMRAKCPDHWVRRLDKRIDSLSPFGVVPTICDLRYLNEYEWAVRSGMLTVRVDATPMDRACALLARGEEGHFAWSDTPSETDLDEAEFDVRFWNPHGSLSVLPHFARLVSSIFVGETERVGVEPAA